MRIQFRIEAILYPVHKFIYELEVLLDAIENFTPVPELCVELVWTDNFYMGLSLELQIHIV